MAESRHKLGQSAFVIRQKLQAGAGRHLIGFAAGIGVLWAIVQNWEFLEKHQISALDAGQKIAFVAAAFGVTAYNLRVRVIDMILKTDEGPSRTAELSMIVRSCGTRLTNLVALFTATALLLGAGGFVPPSLPITRWYAGSMLGLFLMSAVHFAYILFAFERLERFALDDAERRADEKERRRLLGNGGP